MLTSTPLDVLFPFKIAFISETFPLITENFISSNNFMLEFILNLDTPIPTESNLTVIPIFTVLKDDYIY